MNSIIKLRSDDFQIQQGTKGSVLCNGIKGLSLCLFWSPNCQICKNIEPMYRRLPQTINNCKFCLLNINENQSIIALAKETIAPIEFVPYIVFYVNGRPFLQFDDQCVIEKIINFVNYATKLVESKKSFIDKGAVIKETDSIPLYSVAKPYSEFRCDESGFCYLTYSQAYGQGKNQQNKNTYQKQ